MIVVNLFGAPGAGKSTGAAYIFSQLKMCGINAELITEFAKDKVYEESKGVFENQTYIFGKQYFRMTRCADKVDVIVVDSPLLLSCFYDGRNPESETTKAFKHYVKLVFNSFDNVNFFIERVKPYNPSGRFQTEKESDQVAIDLKKMLEEYNVNYHTYAGTIEDYNKIVKFILQILEAEKLKKEI